MCHIKYMKKPHISCSADRWLDLDGAWLIVVLLCFVCFSLSLSLLGICNHRSSRILKDSQRYDW